MDAAHRMDADDVWGHHAHNVGFTAYLGGLQDSSSKHFVIFIFSDWLGYEPLSAKKNDRYPFRNVAKKHAKGHVTV